MSDFRLVTVYRTQGMLPAQVIRGRLESAGIPVFLKYEAIGQVFGLTVDGLGAVKIQVPADRSEDATSVLAEEDSLETEEDHGEESGLD